jgi:large repetitive protein
MKSISVFFSGRARAIAQWALVFSGAVCSYFAYAHSVGQVQTTKFLAPETVTTLLARAATASPGLAVGDVVSYIIQFTPVANGATVGAGGYITDYIPPGTEVVGAAVVAKDGSGNYYNIAPNFPGGIDSGWGDRGQNSFAAPFNTAAYDTTGRCAAAGFTNNCDARINEIYADTGIFYSTDPRTAVFPALPTRILQGVNGYDISPTAEAALNTIIGQTRATTHNLWDANQTNAFGSTAAAVAALVAPASTAPSLIVAGKIGQGATPYNAGSAVAGPQSGYQLDNTGNVGPWQRIAYAGSRIGDNTTGPATVAGISNTAVAGFPTSIGTALSVSNPLPSGTNAVRWAVGKLVVGEIRYVKISLRITAPPTASGIVNSSEVFGGDAGDADLGQDNPWRYHVPSVADNNSNLLVQKAVVCVYNALNVCVPSDGSYVPAGSKVRYRITYLNSGVVPQTNLVLQDVLPCQTAANAASNIAVISGPVTLPAPNPPITAAGNCGTTPDTRSTVTFPTLSSLAAGAGGSVEVDILNNAAAGNLLLNTAKLTSAEVPGGVTANAISNVGAVPNLSITKVANATTTVAGGTSSYTIVVTNVGAGNATGITLYDVLPSMGGAANPATRFSYATTTAVVVAASPAGSSLVLPAVVSTSVPPTLSPYDTLPVASNSQQILWTFGASVLVPGGVMTLTYTANVGASVSASATPYYNNANVLYGGGGSGRSDAPNTAPVLVTSPLSVVSRP